MKGTKTVAKNTASVVKFTNLDENAEVIGGVKYIGEMPRPLVALPGVIRKIYLTESLTKEAMFKVLYEVTQGRYLGFTAWDNVTLNNKAAFKWKPLCEVLGITANELKTNTRVDPEDISEVGMRVTGIGTCDLAGDATVPCYFGVEYKMYDDVKSPAVAASKPRQVANVDGMGEFAPAPKQDDKEEYFPGD